MKKLLLLLLIGFQLAALAQPITLATPESQGFSSERFKRIDREMNGWVDKGWMQGGAALVIRNGKIVYYKAVGYNDKELKVQMQKGSDLPHRFTDQGHHQCGDHDPV